MVCPLPIQVCTHGKSLSVVCYEADVKFGSLPQDVLLVEVLWRCSSLPLDICIGLDTEIRPIAISSFSPRLST